MTSKNLGDMLYPNPPVRFFYDETMNHTLENIKKQYDFFVQQYGSEMIFVPPEKANDVVTGFLNAYNKALPHKGNEPKPKTDSEQVLKQAIVFPTKGIENITIYFNPQNGLEFYPNVAECIDKKENPFFKQVNENMVIDLFSASGNLSTEFYREIVKIFLKK